MATQPVVIRKPGKGKGGWHAVATFGRREVRTLCGISRPMDKWIIGHGFLSSCRECQAEERKR